MFWNDPHMYGMTFPYKEFTPTPTLTPYLGQFYPYQNVPRVLPNYYGALPQIGLPTSPFDPFVMKGIQRDPFVLNQIPNVPFAQVPVTQNLPFCNWIRPF
ncbi:MAG: hypothetical protein GTN89_12075 [Acidobacteria bacterium]|nr:hypothetical protein [Acidobacteriota bacterium]NIM63461.1 hypothetical protein [Acidobacteriota bacterium]NIO60889.1 hypothetical protein [Acidobacteriota bacterium]NIQ31081.1 hypothetical protein [Acidobacteriota bacterium]NIQ87350.1 hypothetical protein [Acidobacteriota bacterium]